jgi:hypothetical protein
VLLVLIGGTLAFVQNCLTAIGLPRRLSVQAARFCLPAVVIGYLLLVPTITIAAAVLPWFLQRSRRPSRRLSRLRLPLARWLFSCSATLLALAMAEAASLARLTWIHRLPAFPGQFVPPDDQGENAIVGEFEHRLEAIVANCEAIGCVPILIIPPGNDASDPSQSHATPFTGPQERRTLFDRLSQLRALEGKFPARAIAAY